MGEISESEARLLAGAEKRMAGFIVASILVGTGAAGWLAGRAWAAAFAVGGVLAYVNYRWIVSVVDTLVRAQSAEVPRRAYLKLLAPLLLLAAFLYVMVARVWLPPVGVIAGWSVLVAAVILEALYQAAHAARH